MINTSKTWCISSTYMVSRFGKLVQRLNTKKHTENNVREKAQFTFIDSWMKISLQDLLLDLCEKVTVKIPSCDYVLQFENFSIYSSRFNDRKYIIQFQESFGRVEKINGEVNDLILLVLLWLCPCLNFLIEFFDRYFFFIFNFDVLSPL